MENDFEEFAVTASTFHFSVRGFSALQDNVPIRSPACYIRNLPWRLVLMPETVSLKGVSDELAKRYLRVDLECNWESKNPNWSICGECELYLVSVRDGIKLHVRKLTNDFSYENPAWCWNEFAPWNDMLSQGKWLIKNDTVTLEASIRTFRPRFHQRDTSVTNKMKVFLVALLAACFTAAFSADINEHWTRFQQTHGKFYKTSLEETLRKEVFIFNYNKIKNHNILYEQGLVSFRLKLNKFADLTSEEFNSLYNGFKRSKAIADADIIPFVPPADVDIPDAFDWRDKGAVTNIKDQEACGSCWTFSSTGALEGQYFLKNGKLASISEQNLVDCSLNDGNSGCDGGDMVPAFTYIFNNNGIDSEKSYPYEAVDGRCRYKLQGNVTTIKSISTIEKANEEHLKAAVATVGPIAVAIDASHDDFQFYDSGVYYREDCEQGLDDVNDLDHAVLAVGYGTENGKDYWLIKNSWGEGWGDEGYIKMSRNRDNNCGVATECSFPILY